MSCTYYSPSYSRYGTYYDRPSYYGYGSSYPSHYGYGSSYPSHYGYGSSYLSHRGYGSSYPSSYVGNYHRPSHYYASSPSDHYYTSNVYAPYSGSYYGKIQLQETYLTIIQEPDITVLTMDHPTLLPDHAVMIPLIEDPILHQENHIQEPIPLIATKE